MELIIRRSTANDMPAVLELIQELATFEKEPHAVVVTVQDLINDGFGATPLFYSFVAVQDNTIVGMALYYYRYSTWKGKTLHLEDLIVKEKMRGTGCGMALYKEVLQQGQIDGVRRIEWNVLGWNKPAIAFYEKTGAKVLNEWWCVQIDEKSVNAFLEK